MQVSCAELVQKVANPLASFLFPYEFILMYCRWWVIQREE